MASLDASSQLPTQSLELSTATDGTGSTEAMAEHHNVVHRDASSDITADTTAVQDHSLSDKNAMSSELAAEEPGEIAGVVSRNAISGAVGQVVAEKDAAVLQRDAKSGDTAPAIGMRDAKIKREHESDEDDIDYSSLECKRQKLATQTPSTAPSIKDELKSEDDKPTPKTGRKPTAKKSKTQGKGKERATHDAGRENDLGDYARFGRQNATLMEDEDFQIERTQCFVGQLKKKLPKPKVTSVKNGFAFEYAKKVDRSPEKDKTYDDRTTVEVLKTAFIKGGCLKKSELRQYINNFDNKDNVKKHVPAGDAAYVQDDDGTNHLLAGAGLFALWGNSISGLDPTHSDYTTIQNVRDANRAPLMLIKSPRAPKNLPGKPLTGLPASLFQPFKQNAARGQTRKKAAARKDDGEDDGKSQQARNDEDADSGEFEYARKASDDVEGEEEPEDDVAV